MTAEQARTLAYYRDVYEKQVLLMDRRTEASSADWRIYQQAVDDYYGYRRWLDTYVLNQRAA